MNDQFVAVEQNEQHIDYQRNGYQPNRQLYKIKAKIFLEHSFESFYGLKNTNLQIYIKSTQNNRVFTLSLPNFL